MEEEQATTEEQQDQFIQELPTEEAQPEEEAEPQEEEVAPTKSIKNFWERLDEVFSQNTEMRQRMEELVDQFPSEQKVSEGPYRSFVFQPERLCISSNDDVNTNLISDSTFVSANLQASGGHEIAETFSSFRIRLAKSLINVKSIQLLSAVIPNAVQNIPNNQTVFFYYRIPTLALSSLGNYSNLTRYYRGDIVFYPVTNTFYCCTLSTINTVPTVGTNWASAGNDGTRPNYFAIGVDTMNAVFLNPTNSSPPDYTSAARINTYNRTYTSYDDLVSALNLCTSLIGQIAGAAPINSVTFAYNDQLNKIQMIPDPTQIAAGYFFFPAGYEDPNVAAFMAPNEPGGIFEDIAVNFTPGYTLNLRLGFTWNGVFFDAFTVNPYQVPAPGSCKTSLYWYMRPTDPGFGAPVLMSQDITTANSYGDLVNTSCVRVYCDASFASTEDSNGQQGLLSVIPVNTTNLGIGFYQNNFSNPLTKVPKIISEIGIRLVNDQGLPYVLPNSATVLLEIAISYH